MTSVESMGALCVGIGSQSRVTWLLLIMLYVFTGVATDPALLYNNSIPLRWDLGVRWLVQLSRWEVRFLPVGILLTKTHRLGLCLLPAILFDSGMITVKGGVLPSTAEFLVFEGDSILCLSIQRCQVSNLGVRSEDPGYLGLWLWLWTCLTGRKKVHESRVCVCFCAYATQPNSFDDRISWSVWYRGCWKSFFMCFSFFLL